MAVVTIPNTFVPNTTILSAQVNANFNAIAAYLNTGTGTFATSGYVVLPGALYVQWGNLASTAADGSALTAVTFNTTFPNACFMVVPAIKNTYQTNNWELSIQHDTPSTTGFNVNVAGAPTGKTVAVTYIAIGN